LGTRTTPGRRGVKGDPFDGHYRLLAACGFADVPVLSTLLALRADMIDHRDRADNIAPTDATDPMDRIESADPTDRTEPTDPTDPTERTDPFDPMLKNESSDHSDNLELLLMWAIFASIVASQGGHPTGSRDRV
jgi:hypothetical protein